METVALPQLGHHTTLSTKRKRRAGDGWIFAFSLLIAFCTHNGLFITAAVGGVCEMAGLYGLSLSCAKYTLEYQIQHCYADCGTCAMGMLQEHHERVDRLQQKVNGTWNPMPDQE